jgi:hypothetical protein
MGRTGFGWLRIGSGGGISVVVFINNNNNNNNNNSDDDDDDDNIASLSPQRGACSGWGWWRRPSDMEVNCEDIE